MKKTIVLIISLLFAGTLAAQPLQFGVKAGLTMLSTDVRSWNDAREKLKANDVGFTAGIMARLNLPVPGLYVQPELIWNNARYKITDSEGKKTKEAYNNLELPVLVGFKLLFFRANVGPVFNLKTFEKGSNNYDIHRPDIGYQAGFGVTLRKFEVDFRYHGYFGKSTKGFSAEHLNDKIKVKNSYLSLTLGFLL